MEKKTIGAFIAALRKANGLTQKQLADKLCVSDKAVSRWERDESLPDLMLIPVIAEIFCVTSDELLRGQRANPGTPIPNNTAEKTGKQLHRYLSAAKTKFKIQCIISIVIAFTGFITALICNFAFTRANLGFLLSCVFYGVAIACQVSFSILSSSNIDVDELESDTVNSIKKYLHWGNQIVYCSIATLLGLSLPFVIHVHDAYYGLPANTYAVLSLLYAPSCTGLCALVCWIINIRLGYTSLSQKVKIRLITFAILIPIIGLTWLAHYFSTELLYANRYLLADHTTYDSFQAFIKAIETPLDPEGNPLTLYETYYDVAVYKDKAGERIHVHRCVVTNSDVPNLKEYSYWHANKTISEYCNDGSIFHTMSPEQAATASRYYQIICMTLFTLYPIEIAAAIFISHQKMKKLPKNA